ncbi:serine protease inhibitor ecotin [Methylobacillus flagellatus]|uniref:Putative ecotin-like protein n=1 Tax=Methylobacillus flagellatus (strain ATCC 51484 / DSM 6875 / VKM B-1610 / KT) TaxID=265072 RepID=ECOTL_METFK|nr:serine protease inhibitor ecotin [Methylobacillus flagellatus]Q1H1S3.1 RecName: Full=Putative ecotin-like protein; Flags: Precursor [Methylobacillus flagellatus KT]ABE49564.1 proteinase inhibitor I11, ecotin [Methylobacillus flagellatus KT]
MSLRPIETAIASLTMLMLQGCAHAGKLDEKVPYPQPADGYQRNVIHLPMLADEENTKLELQVGKTMQVDCNHHSFGATVVEHTVKGWGYPYYEVNSIGGPISTRMACPSGTETSKFVAAHGNGFVVRYNSKLPVVVYIPQGFELRYRTWQPVQEFQTVPQD